MTHLVGYPETDPVRILNGNDSVTILATFPVMYNIDDIMLGLAELHPDKSRVVKDDTTIYWFDDAAYINSTDIISAYNVAYLKELISNKLSGAEALTEQKLSEGMPYNFSGNLEVVQTREKDKLNLIAINITASTLKNMGVTAPFTTFRTLSNSEYSIDPDQGLAISMAAFQYISRVYKISWRYKDSIRAATTVAELDASTWEAAEILVDSEST